MERRASLAPSRMTRGGPSQFVTVGLGGLAASKPVAASSTTSLDSLYKPRAARRVRREREDDLRREYAPHPSPCLLGAKNSGAHPDIARPEGAHRHRDGGNAHAEGATRAPAHRQRTV